MGAGSVQTLDLEPHELLRVGGHEGDQDKCIVDQAQRLLSLQ